MSDGRSPTYGLTIVQENARAGQPERFWVRRSAFYDAMALGFDQNDIRDCVLELDEGDFFKTMRSTEKSSLMQDVYRTTYSNRRLYVKVQLDPDQRTVVISFKKDQSR